MISASLATRILVCPAWLFYLERQGG